MADSSRAHLTRIQWLWAAFVCVLAVAADQVTKLWARSALGDTAPRPLVGDWLSLRLVHNSGAAFSLGADRTWVLTIITVVIIALLVALLTRIRRFSALRPLPC